MTSNKDRFIAALEGGAPIPPPAAPLYLGLYLEPHRRKLFAGVYAEMAEGESSLRLTFDEEIEARLEALTRAAALFEEPPAWLPVGLGPTRESVHGAKVTFPPGHCLWHPPGQTEPTDFLAPFDNSHGDVWEKDAELPAVEDVRAERREHSADDLIEAGCLEYPRRALERLGDRFVLTGAIGAPFWHCYQALGFVGMMRALRERPELIEAACAVDIENGLVTAHALWEAGIRRIFVEECFAGSDLISAEDYLRFAYPPTREFLAALRDIGFRTVYYFCGGVEERLQRLASLPADAMAFEESKKSFVIDLARSRAEIGPDILLFGNTDAVLLRDGTEEQIAADVARQYAEAGPHYVASMGSPATLDTPPQKLDMLVRAAEALG